MKKLCHTQHEALKGLRTIAIDEAITLDMAFKQTDAIWVSRFGSPPPGLK